ncbi:hypothetical protein ACN47E_001617 [Coniothyrium glycines]
MGTLTADVPRLDSHCPHKLATSCRLTSTPKCCACADERQHSRTYRVYIDGVGFVQRGTRWQGYCWFCKEFWTNRLAATDPPLEVSQTRIPQVPDQSEFLGRWAEFHQGYRIAKLADGTEHRIAVVGEPFKEVSPGFLPRSLAELRAGVRNDARRPENRVRRGRLADEDERPEMPQQSLEEALDSLLQDADADAEDESPAATQPAPLVPQFNNLQQLTAAEPARPLTRRETQMQRNRERFARVFGSVEDVQQDDYVSPLTTMYGRAYDRYRQAEERRAEGTSEAPPLEGLSAQERRDIEEQLLWGVMRESQAMSQSLEQEGDVWSYAPRNIAGINSDTTNLDNFDLRAGEDPAAALARYVQGRVVHSADGRMILTASEASDAIQRMVLAQDQTQSQESQPTIPSTSSGPSNPLTATALPSSTPPAGFSEVRSSIQQITSELQRLRLASEALSSARHSLHARNHPAPPPPSLDNQPNRPPPKTDEEMTKILACQVCYQQLADTAVLPCGHMVMCQWCADVVIPVKHSHLPVRPSKCPMCRKAVKQRFRIHM